MRYSSDHTFFGYKGAYDERYDEKNKAWIYIYYDEQKWVYAEAINPDTQQYKVWHPNSWMVYNGQSQTKMNDN
jgi:hypothetical protein